MAVNRKEKATSILINVQTGLGKVGMPVYAKRVISSVNPEITDENAFAVGKELAALQKHTLGNIERSDRAQLAEG